MFRRASLAYVVIALTGVALLSMMTDDGGTVRLADLEGHVGESVRVEAMVVAVDGDRTVLWDAGRTVDAYGENPHDPGDRVRAEGYVSMGRNVYLNVDRYVLVHEAEPRPVGGAAEGSWVECSGVLVERTGSVFVRAGSLDVPLEFHIDVEPVDGIEVTVQGVFHGGTVHVFDRSSVSTDDVFGSPWALVGTVTVQGVVEFEPGGTALTLGTIDGNIRVVCNTTGVHMCDIVECTGTVEYDGSNARFYILGTCRPVQVNGPVAVSAEELFASPWRYEDAEVTIFGNVTDTADGRSLSTTEGAIPLNGHRPPGPGYVTGTFVLDDGLRYVIDVG